MIKAVIFDMDGVIFDTENVSIRRWFELSDKYGFNNIKDIYSKIIGTNTVTTKQILLNEYCDINKVEYFLKETREKFFEIINNEGLSLKPGVIELLSYLKSNNYKIALASSTAVDIVKSELRQTNLIDYFDFIIGGDMVELSKPNPEIFEKACIGLNVLNKDALIIEDSHNGIRAAYTAGIPVIMVPDLMPITKETKEKTIATLESLIEVKNWIINKT